MYHIDKINIIKVQVILQIMGFNPGDPDGILGKKTKHALKQAIISMSKPYKRYHTSSYFALFIQMQGELLGIQPNEIDGSFGPNTENVLDQIYYLFTMKKLMPEIDRKPVYPDKIYTKDDGTEVKLWPSYRDPEAFMKVFGEPGEQIVDLKAPYPMFYAFDKSIEIKIIRCNSAVKDSLERVYTNVLDCYGLENIRLMNLDLFAGCFVFRQMKGSSKLSTHSWGIAVDTDPENNRLNWGKDKARFAHSEFDEWHKAWRDEGAINLGIEKNFDFMHTQFCGL